jgi:integrase
MAHVEKRGVNRYRARWIDPEGRERSKTFTAKKEAEDHLTTVEGTKLAGTYIVDSKVTVAEYAYEWASSRPHRATTAARTRHIIDKHIAGSRLGDRRLCDVRPSEVQAWATERSKVLAPSTVRLVVSILRAVFNAAVQDRLRASSPATKLSLPRSEAERIVPLTITQVIDLAHLMPERCYAMVITQAGLGLRIGELMALRQQDVDWLRHTARVQDQLTIDGKGRMDPKTPRSRRTVPLPDVVAEALSQHVAKFPSAEDGLIFTTKHGLPWRREYHSRTFAKAVTAANLPAGTTSHDLRHHYVSVLLDAGESVVTVAERIGDTPERVLQTYAHIMPDREDRTRRAIDQAWSNDGLTTAWAAN